MSLLIGQLVGQIVGAAIGALFGALILQLICTVLYKFKPPYGVAYRATFFGYLSSALIGFVVGLFIGLSGQLITATSLILLMVIGFFVQTAFYAHLIEHPETGSIGFSKAALVSLLQLVFGALLISGVVILNMVNTRPPKTFITQGLERVETTQYWGIEETRIPTATPVFVYGCVSAEKLNVRVGPGVMYQVVGYLSRNDCRIFLERDANGKWIRFRGGWVSAHYIEEKQGAIMALPVYKQASPPSTLQVRICSCSANIYDCKDFPSQAAAQACYQYCLRLTGRDVHWLDDDKDGIACEYNP